MRALVLLMMVGCAEEAIVDDTSVDADSSLDTEAEEGTEAETDTEADTEADTETPATLASNGTWDTSNFTVDSDPCSLGTFRDPTEFLPEMLVITDSTSASFDMGEPGGDSQECTLNGSQYSCGRFERIEDSGFGADLIIDTGLSGMVLSSTQLDGVLDLVMTCSGGGCGLLELGGLTFPCAFEGSFDLDLQ
jgi:hypothetical protein